MKPHGERALQEIEADDLARHMCLTDSRDVADTIGALCGRGFILHNEDGLWGYAY